MSSSTDRAIVRQIASTSPEQALRLARGIDSPWFRCQALSTIAEVEADKKACLRLLKEALSAAWEQNEPNRVVTVSAWPLQVMAHRGWVEALMPEVTRLLAYLATEPHAVRRADALYVLMDKLRAGPLGIFREVLHAFEAACLAMPIKAKKREWLLRNGVEVAAAVDSEKARELAEHIRRPMLRQQAFEALDRAGDRV